MRQTGLRVIESNRLETLIDDFAGRLHGGVSPMRRDIVVVQSRGMERFLRLELAKRDGVCLGPRFLFPIKLAYDLFRRALPEMPREDPYASEVMAWRILDALDGLLPDPDFAPVRGYLEGDRRLKRWQLASALAGVFDRYVIFRSDMILDWEEGRLLLSDSLHEAWQAKLWRAAGKELNGEHRAAIKERFLVRLPEVPDADLPERLFFFGLGWLPRFYAAIFGALASRLPITAYVLQPGALPSPGGPGLAGQSLAGALNRQGEDFRVSLAENGASFDFRPAATDGDSLLARLQTDMLFPGQKGDHGLGLPEGDVSIQFHSCHGPMREVEILHDNILWALSHGQGVEPRDILVACPNLDAYEPYIKAVFGAATGSGPRLPHTVYNPSAAAANPLVRVVLKILDLPLDRSRPPGIMSLLECAAIRDMFEIGEAQLPLIETWVAEAGARFARDAREKQDLGLPGLPEFTWAFAMERLILGFALPEEGLALYAGTAPLGLAEGSQAQVLGRFLDFLKAVFAALDSLVAPAAATLWRERLGSILDALFVPDERLEPVRIALGRIEDAAAMAGSRMELDLCAFKEALRAQLAEAASSGGLRTGGITFTDLVTLRGVPFKIICLLGMNWGVIPRRDRAAGFDLMAAAPQPGDPSARDEDRRLFLEAILSTRQMLIISYQGQSTADNADLPPSVLVSELLDHLDQRYELSGNKKAREELVRVHKLQAFHPAYFGGDPKAPLFSFSEQNLGCAGSGPGGIQPKDFAGSLPDKPGIVPDPVPLLTLRQFLSNPARFFLKERLGLFLEKGGDELADVEPLDGLDGLERYLLGAEILKLTDDGCDAAQAVAYFQAANRLPPGVPGQLTAVDIIDDMAALAAAIKALPIAEPPRGVSDIVTTPAGRLIGSIDRIYEKLMLRSRPAKVKAKDLLATWADHLFLNALSVPGLPKVSVHVGKDDTRFFTPVEDAPGHLAALLELLRLGACQALPFFPASSHAYAETLLVKNKTEKAALSEARKQWKGDRYAHTPEEGADVHFAQCFKAGDPFGEEFKRLALAVFSPLFDHIEDSHVF